MAGENVTTNFHRVDGAALGAVTNLAAGTYSWSASICDYAGNVVSNAGTFYATGAVNPLAPVISDVNLPADTDYCSLRSAAGRSLATNKPFTPWLISSPSGWQIGIRGCSQRPPRRGG